MILYAYICQSHRALTLIRKSQCLSVIKQLLNNKIMLLIQKHDLTKKKYLKQMLLLTNYKHTDQDYLTVLVEW